VHAVDKPLANGQYYWRVASKDSLGNRGPWSESRQLTVEAPENTPLLVSPSDGAILREATLEFVWTSLDHVMLYSIEIAADSTFETKVIDRENWPGISYSTDSLTEDGTYYWRVAGEFAGGYLGDWSDVWRFQIQRILPFEEKKE
jgi:hypothetical protein